MKRIYLDYAAATPIDPMVVKAMAPFLMERFYNPSAGYLAAQSVRQDLDKARAKIARRLGAKPAEIIFTSGATEANNLALRGIAEAHPHSKLIVSAIEHESVLAPAKKLGGLIAPVGKHGIVDLAKLEKMIDDQTILVSLILVSNELGSLQPIAQVAEAVKQIRGDRLRRKVDRPLYLHSDAAQAANYFELNVARLGVDLLTVNGSKLYGPKQTGVLYVRAGTKIKPQIIGGGQEFGLRSGTENVAGFIGLAEAYELAHDQRASEVNRLQQLRVQFIEELLKAIPSALINGHPKRTAPHIINVRLPGKDAERLMMELDECGIEVAVGSACGAANEEPSHVLRAIGLSDGQARECLRFSLGRPTTAGEITRTVATLAKLLKA